MNTKWSVILIAAMILAAALSGCCARVSAQVEKPTPKPESVVKLVENNDNEKNIYTTSHGFNRFDDVSLEKDMAAAQVMCKVQQSISVGGPSMLNADELTVEKCPELLTGVRMQVVDTQTKYSFDCRNCSVSFDGAWEYGQGVSTWRGTVRITPTSNKTPSLYLVPLRQP